jgi:hypothetical protein
MIPLLSQLPAPRNAETLAGNCRRAFIGAYGFEERSLGWCKMQKNAISAAFVFKYLHPKGPNLIDQLKTVLRKIGAEKITNIRYDILYPQPLEDELPQHLVLDGFDEVVVDISSMTKLGILLVLSKLEQFPGTVRLVYSEARDYCPSKAEYDPVQREMAATARFPSRGAEQVVRLRCLSSIRMQGQPITLIAFTSFNEKLVSHMLGFLSPHRLVLLNGRPPRKDYAWRERATHDIHKRLITEYEEDNPLDTKGLLKRSASTLDYRQTVEQLENIYVEYGLYERIVCAATGSKMQTVGLFLSKVRHRDIQIEYPTPDSYFVKEMTLGIRRVHEVVFEEFKTFVANLPQAGLPELIES